MLYHFVMQIEYDPRSISFRQLLEVFWTSHDSRQVFGQGPDVGNQYRCWLSTVVLELKCTHTQNES